jgi:hypothetical protein
VQDGSRHLRSLNDPSLAPPTPEEVQAIAAQVATVLAQPQVHPAAALSAASNVGWTHRQIFHGCEFHSDLIHSRSKAKLEGEKKKKKKRETHTIPHSHQNHSRRMPQLQQSSGVSSHRP